MRSRFCEEARRLRPDMTFGADIIAGFPTETEAHFDELAELVEDCDLTWLHVFPFSPRPGTPAARMPPSTAHDQDRAHGCARPGSAPSERHLAAQVGQTHRPDGKPTHGPHRAIRRSHLRHRSARGPDRRGKDHGSAGRAAAGTAA
jgi:MoaA/NifB/PqqE/SkfB family radical SAM enzyme